MSPPKDIPWVPSDRPSTIDLLEAKVNQIWRRNIYWDGAEDHFLLIVEDRGSIFKAIDEVGKFYQVEPDYLFLNFKLYYSP